MAATTGNANRSQQRVAQAPKSPYQAGNRVQPQLAAAPRQQPATNSQQTSATRPQTTSPRWAPQPGSPAVAIVPSTRTTTTPVAQAPAATPKTSLADQLVIEAHNLSTSLAEGAGTEADFTRIIDNCRRARATKPSADTARYASELASWAFNRRGELRAEAGRDAEAINDFDNAIRADANRWRAIHNRGVLRAQAGDCEKAFDDFNRTIELNPEFAKAYSNRAALFVVAGNLETSLADYARALELDPAMAVAHRGRGRACHLLGRLDEAASHYQQAVQLAPEDAYAAACYGDLLVDIGRYAEARGEYDRAIELDPQSDQAYSGSAWLLATCPDSAVRNHELAISRAGKAIELTGNQDAVCLDALAAAQASAGDFTAAVGTMRQAVQVADDGERKAYEQRLQLYQHAKPYRLAPAAQLQQASYEEASEKPAAERWE